MDERPELPNFNQDFCLKVAKFAAATSLVLLTSELLILIAVGPSNPRCPGYIIYAKNGSGTSLWLLVAIFSGGPAIALWHRVLNWDRMMQKMYDQFTGKAPPHKSWLLGMEQGPASWFLVDGTKLFVRVTIAFSLFCAVPLWWIINSCTPLQLEKTFMGWLIYIRDITY